jgi:hypothetical protein
MTPARPSLLLLMAVVPLAACATKKKPLTGYDEPPPGSIALNSDPGGVVVIWPIFDLPSLGSQMFRARVDGQDAVYATSEPGLDEFYDYYMWSLGGWTGGYSNWLPGIPPGAHVMELVDGAGQSWGRSAPLPIGAVANPTNPSGQLPAAIFAHFDGKVASWTIDPTTQDADTATDEITVTNRTDGDVVVERCLVSSGKPSSCTSVGTVAPGADLATVERMEDVAVTDDHHALVMRLASDASQSYQRDLLPGSGSFNFGSTCQIERIIVHGPRANSARPPGSSAIAMSSCYGYLGGPM